MPSFAPRFHDLHALTRECRGLGDDPRLWREHLFQELCRLTGADIGKGGERGGCRDGRLRGSGIADRGWGNGFDRGGWLRSVVEFDQNPLDNPWVNGYVARLAREDGVSLSRRDFMPDCEWYRTVHNQTCYIATGIDMTPTCFREVPGGAGEFSGLLISRARGARNFSARDRAVLSEAHTLIAPLVGGPLARFEEPSPGDLPHRPRQVLRCLLDGDSDKQIAARLDISPYTVNQYVKHVFRHFGVQTRTELLARWVRRGWGGRCAWADE